MSGTCHISYADSVAQDQSVQPCSLILELHCWLISQYDPIIQKILILNHTVCILPNMLKVYTDFSTRMVIGERALATCLTSDSVTFKVTIKHLANLKFVITQTRCLSTSK